MAGDEGLEALPLAECERRLAMGGVGVLALATGAAPLLRPVNFAVDGRRLLIRTGEGQIRAAAASGAPGSLVITELDRLEHTGWSVVVTGTLSLLSGAPNPGDVRLRPWARAEKRNLVALSMDAISGRRIAPPMEEP
jgi:nitroimidazol reductase NimA-like FMN-containing flavoprotein (pyridoxamine 5'-phosphate oxidase superfamily)